MEWSVTETVSKLYAGTDREMWVYWEHDRPARVTVSEENSPWRTPAGIRVGTGLGEAVIFNDGPFAFCGFEWDYAGKMGSWLGGKLARDHAIGHYFDAQFHYPQSADRDALYVTCGDKVFRRKVKATGVDLWATPFAPPKPGL